METGSEVGNENSLSDSFLTSGQINQAYVVEGGDGDDAVGSGEGEEDPGNNEPLREQDRFLPIANVARIMKKSVPTTGKIAKDAKECVQECVSEFISFITSEASERCHQEKRKTINGEDILFAMSTLGFDSYVEPLKLYLQKYRESSKSEKGISSNTTSQENTLDDIAEESFGNTMLGDGQSNVIYTTAYPTQIQQQLTFT